MTVRTENRYVRKRLKVPELVKLEGYISQTTGSSVADLSLWFKQTNKKHKRKELNTVINQKLKKDNTV